MADERTLDSVQGFGGFEDDVARLWTQASGTGPQTRLFRKSFDLDAPPLDATLHLFAESRYHVWINDHYLGRGPTFHHPTELLVDSYAVESHLVRGRNVIAVLVQEIDVSFHNRIRSGEPGLVAQLDLVGSDRARRSIKTDATWRVTDQTGWRPNPPRRSWAIDYLEDFDMSIAPQNWQTIDFDDTGWQTPDAILPATRIPGGSFRANPLPALRHRFQPPGAFMGAFGISAPAQPERIFKSTGELGNAIMSADWTPRPNLAIDARDGAFAIDLDSSSEGVVLCFDLGAEFVGQVVLDCDCPSAGTIDIGWSEVAENGRPRLVRKGVGYLDRIHAAKGALRWSPIQFSAMRYLVLVLRGFTGSLRVQKFGVRATEPDLNWDNRFQSSDQTLNAIFEMCQRSHQVGTQETQMDCPSREQAAYVGDGMLTARWLTQLTGDVRHWRYLVHEQFRRQSPSGVLRASIFSGRNDTCVDYTLLAVVGLRDYFHYTRDLDSVRDLIEPARKAFLFFDRYRADHGLCTWSFKRDQPMADWENTFDPSLPIFGESDGLVLIIDHPGMGWHNKNEAGIDRSGTNAALNLFIVMAKRALADLEAALGEHERARLAREDADRLAALCQRAFFNSSASVYVDGVQNGEPLTQLSEQTNTLAVAARCCDDDTARKALRDLLTSNDETIARNGPYFWAYLYPELMRLGLHDLATTITRAKWGAMLAGGASTLWETFLGDDLDSWCHPWAGAPIDFVLSGLLGLPDAAFDEDAIVLKPRFDLLAEASGSIHTRLGLFSIAWKRVGDAIELQGETPSGVRAQVIAPDGQPIASIDGRWTARQRA